MRGTAQKRMRGPRRWRGWVGAAMALLIGLALGPPPGAAAAPGLFRPDRGFGAGGIVAAHPRFSIDPNAVTVDSRERILVAGLNESSGGAAGTVVFRFLPDGRRDRSFGRSGLARLEGFGNDIGLVADRSGGVYVLASDFGFGEWLEHLDERGVPDRRFGTRGRVSVPLSYETAQEAEMSHPLVGLPGGGLVVAGRGGTDEERARGRGPLELRRFSAEGHLVRAFGHDGVVALGDPRLRQFRMRDLAATVDGAVLVSGSISIPVPVSGPEPGVEPTSVRRLAVVKLLADGRLARRFGTRGIATPRLPGDSIARMVLGEPNGDVLVAALVTRANPRAPEYGFRRPLLLRLGPDGSVVRRFPKVPRDTYESGYEAALLASNMSDLAVASGHVFAATGSGEVGSESLLAYSLDGRPDGFVPLGGRAFERIAGLTARRGEAIVLAQRAPDPTKSPAGFVLRAFHVGG